MRERNLALKICKNYRKSQMNMRIPNIKQLNDQFLQFYRSEQTSKPQLIPSIQQKQEFGPMIED